ncbi:isocitrate lyase/PEP mutase family protein [Sulfitobacter sp. JB4-11]|uniref:isocitrate lyase/PEP mutase family protein n=1 Tax=Sulfitobacter rhodophyticola TaxID=3238304 RepID=UPI003D817C27
MFAQLHTSGKPLLMPNPWDAGSAVMLKAMGFQAFGSTSAGAAYTAGRPEGTLSLDEMLDAAETLARVSGLPVSADLENGGSDTPEAAAHAIREVGKRGLAGASIEDCAPGVATYPMALSIARVEAAVAAAKDTGVVLTARAEGLQGDAPDLEDICTRISAFSKAGADVVFAPGLTDADMVRAVVKAAGDTPVSVILGAPYGALTVARLADLGVARISLGSSLARAAYGGALTAARNLLEKGSFALPENTYSFDEIEALLRG